MSKSRVGQSTGLWSRPVPLLSVAALVILLLWIGFTATWKPHELLVGLGATAVTLALFANLLRNQMLQFSFHPRDVLLIWQLPGAILKDCWILLVVLFKDLTGKERAGSFYRACGFHLSPKDPLLVGRGALAVVFTTMSPNMMVIGIDPAQSLMIFHQLQRDTIPPYARALGAGAQSLHRVGSAGRTGA